MNQASTRREDPRGLLVSELQAGGELSRLLALRVGTGAVRLRESRRSSDEAPTDEDDWSAGARMRSFVLSEVAGYMRSRTEGSRFRRVVLEDPVARPTDLVVGAREPWFTHGDEMYLVLRSGSSSAEIEVAIRVATYPWRFLCVFTHTGYPGQRLRGQDVNIDTLKQLADSAARVLVGVLHEAQLVDRASGSGSNETESG